MSVFTPTIDTFKTQFSRAFIFGVDVPNVRDIDITNAIAEAEAVFNPGLYPTDNISPGTLAELHLSAHFLLTDIDAADSGGQTRLLQNSRSVDGVSESLDIPDWMRAGEFSFYATTYYGQKYLILSKPYLGGAALVVGGNTMP